MYLARRKLGQYLLPARRHGQNATDALLFRRIFSSPQVAQTDVRFRGARFKAAGIVAGRRLAEIPQKHAIENITVPFPEIPDGRRAIAVVKLHPNIP